MLPSTNNVNKQSDSSRIMPQTMYLPTKGDGCEAPPTTTLLSKTESTTLTTTQHEASRLHYVTFGASDLLRSRSCETWLEEEDQEIEEEIISLRGTIRIREQHRPEIFSPKPAARKQKRRHTAGDLDRQAPDRHRVGRHRFLAAEFAAFRSNLTRDPSEHRSRTLSRSLLEFC